MLANQIRPTTLSAAIVFRYIRFWPKKHRVLPFVAIALFYLGTCAFLHGSLLYISAYFMCNYSGMCFLCFLAIRSGHQVRWTYQPESHRRKVIHNFFIHLSFAVRALIFLARRIQRFLSLVDREVEFCVLAI